jgi:hypothetical protein
MAYRDTRHGHINRVEDALLLAGFVVYRIFLYTTELNGTYLSRYGLLLEEMSAGRLPDDSC